MRRQPVLPRFWKYASRPDAPGGCWEWKANRLPSGYGILGVKGRTKYAHRISHELFKGPIPEGLEIDHLCRNRGCCNPDHLEAVTRAENVRRGGNNNRAKTHCPRGHPYDVVYANGWRKCNACRRERYRESVR